MNTPPTKTRPISVEINLARTRNLACTLTIAFLFSGCGRSAETPIPQSQQLAPEHTNSVATPVPEAPNAIPLVGSDDLQNVAANNDDDDDPIEASIEFSASQWQERVAIALAEGDAEVAYQSARKASAIAPNDPKGMFLMARVLADRRRFHEATRMLDKAAQLDPAARLPALGQTAQWLVQQGDWTEAERRLRALLKESGGALMVRRELASLYSRQGRRFDASKQARVLCRHGDINLEELRLLLSVAIPFSLDTESGEGPIGSLGIAHAHAAMGQWKEAAETLADESTDGFAFPELANAFLGRCLANQAESTAFETWILSAAPTVQSNADTWFAHGVYQASRDQNADAVKCFCETVVRDTTDADAYLKLSESLEILGFADQSETALLRSELIRQTQTMGQELAASSVPDAIAINELANLLGKLRRPTEQNAWRAVAIAYSNSDLSDSERKQRLTDINNRRLELLESKSNQPEADFILCGVDLTEID